MSILFLDIETIPSQKPGALDDILATITPPGNITKQESKDKWMAESAEKTADEKWRRTSLDGSQGEILCIGWAIDNGPTGIFERPIGQREDILLSAFFMGMAGEGINHLSTIVGHNVKDFDLRFLYQRCVVNRVQPPFPLRNESRYTGEFVFDTMLSWAGWGNRISLKNLCSALGIPAKEGDIDGSKVWDYVKAGRYKDIFEYCMSDVEATREVYKRLTFGGVL